MATALSEEETLSVESDNEQRPMDRTLSGESRWKRQSGAPTSNDETQSIEGRRAESPLDASEVDTYSDRSSYSSSEV